MTHRGGIGKYKPARSHDVTKYSDVRLKYFFARVACRRDDGGVVAA